MKKFVFSLANRTCSWIRHLLCPNKLGAAIKDAEDKSRTVLVRSLLCGFYSREELLTKTFKDLDRDVIEAPSLLPSIYIYILYIYISKIKKKNTLSSRQACFVISHSSGDFNDKNIHNHRLYTKNLHNYRCGKFKI